MGGCTLLPLVIPDSPPHPGSCSAWEGRSFLSACAFCANFNIRFSLEKLLQVARLLRMPCTAALRNLHSTGLALRRFLGFLRQQTP
jgi:hypothetical protein